MGLAQIEEQLLQHAFAEKRRWQEIAQLLMQVDRQRLWEGHAASFSAWTQGMARRADLQESVFWRCLKAGRIYLELTGSDRLDVSVQVSAESLELADKISRHAPTAVSDKVLTGTLSGELSRGELRQVWQTYRPAAGGDTARGRLPTDPKEREQALAARQAHWQAEQKKPENRAEVQRAELTAGFRDARWLGSFDQARAETRARGLAGTVASILCVRRDAHEPGRIELHGLWTCVSEPELADYEFGPAPAIDFMWLAVPQALSAKTLAKAPRLLGVLELQRERTLVIKREAQRRRIEAQPRVELLAALLGRAYLWPD